MLLKEIANQELSYDAQDLLDDFEDNLVAMIKMQKGARPISADVFLETLDRKAHAVRSRLIRYGVNLETARSLIQQVVTKHRSDIDQLFRFSATHDKQ